MAILLAMMAAASVLAILIFNTLVARRNEVRSSLATIDATLKKRFELIPNLAASVKENAPIEASALEQVVAMQEAQAESLAQLQRLDTESSTVLKGLMVRVEAHPDLKSSQNFARLQSALEEVEEQLAAARSAYNSAAASYNHALEMFPTKVVAELMAYRPAALIALPDGGRGNAKGAELFKG
jgi:LemA protein